MQAKEKCLLRSLALQCYTSILFIDSWLYIISAKQIEYNPVDILESSHNITKRDRASVKPKSSVKTLKKLLRSSGVSSVSYEVNSPEISSRVRLPRELLLSINSLYETLFQIIRKNSTVLAVGISFK